MINTHIEDKPKIMLSYATRKKLAMACFALAGILSIKVMIDLSAMI